MTDTQPQRSVLWPALRRFWPVALLTAVVAGVSTSLLVEATSRPTVVASASYVVPVAPPVAPTLPGEIPPAPSPLPSSPGQASDFAEVYAVLLREDGAVLQALAQAAGTEPNELSDRLQAAAIPGGSVIEVSYTAGTREETAAVLDALDAILLAPTSVTPNIPAGNLRPLNRGAVLESDGLAPLAPVVGALVGLLLGIGAAVVLERGDSRFRSGEDVRALVPWPVLALSHDPDDPRAEVLAERVRRAGDGLRSVALVAPRGTRPADLEDLAWVLSEADRSHDGDGAVSWTVAGVLRGEGDTEQRAQDADALVLVVPPKAPMRHLTAAVRAVQDLAVDPVVVALPARPRRTSRMLSPRSSGSSSGSSSAAATGSSSGPGEDVDAATTVAEVRGTTEAAGRQDGTGARDPLPRGR